MQLFFASLVMLGLGHQVVPATHTPPACGFSIVRRSSAPPEISGSDDLTGRLIIVPQPDSPVEITAVDLTKMVVTIDGPSYRADKGEYSLTVKNRSDQAITELTGIVGFRIGTNQSGTAYTWMGQLAPGETVRVVGRYGGMSASGTTMRAGRVEPSGDVTLFASVDSVRMGGCRYLPSKSWWESTAR